MTSVGKPFLSSVSVLLAVTSVLFVTGCVTTERGRSRKIAPLPPLNPNLDKEFYEEPAGSRFRYLDNQGRYTVNLYAGGAYHLVTLSQDQPTTGEREGSWAWKSTGEKEGILTLDDVAWDLYFATPDMSTAQTKGDVRIYRFAWERLSSAQKPPPSRAHY